MKGKVTIGTKKVEMVANAATPVFYNLIFHRDYFVDYEEYAKTPTTSDSVAIFTKIGFICAHQAKKGCDVQNLSFDDYLKWLEQFDAYDMAHATDEIFLLYTHQAEETAIPK